jgi:rhodanese-related sulfurtransferase
MFAIVVLMIALIAPAYAQQTPGYGTISVDELALMLEDKDFSLVNVHIPYEGELPQTDAFIQFDQIADNLDKLPAAKDAKIVLYCRSGRMSEIAGATLAGLGYTNVFHVEGGFNAWSTAGRDLLQR